MKLSPTGTLNMDEIGGGFPTWNMNFQVATFVEIVGKVHFMFGVSLFFTTGWMVFPHHKMIVSYRKIAR